MFNSFQVCWNFFFLTTGSSMACSSRVDVGNGVQIRWRENWAPYFLLAAGPRRMSVSCVALSLNCFQIGRWLIYFFFPLCWKEFFSFLPLCVHLLQKKKKTFAIFFLRKTIILGCFWIQNGKAYDQVDFYPVCFASFLARSGRGFFPASLSNSGMFLSLRAFALHKIMILLWCFTISCCFG